MVRIPPTAMELVLLGRLFGECHNLFFGVSPVPRIALLCDVLEGRSANLNADKSKILDQLVEKEFVVAADQDSPAKYKLTGKAQQLLAERGVGLSGG